MKNTFLAALLIGLLSSQLALASPSRPMQFKSKGQGVEILTSIPLFDQDTDRYQIGDEFGKMAVTPAMLQQDAILRRIAMATAKYSSFLGGGTAWYLGKFNGHHIMATNHHVADGIPCASATIAFPFINNGAAKSFKCEKLYGTWTAIDFALFVLKVPAADEALFTGIGQNLRWTTEIKRGQEFMTVGFGIAKNPGQRNMMVNQDRDCKAYSGDGEYRFMGDPDEVNPGPYQAWSFSSGCDVSHGDSGSAFIDRRTGDVVGIIWTGGIPAGGKPAQVRTRAFMDSLTTASPEVWTMLSYSVPASKIQAHLAGVVRGGTLPDDDARTIGKVIR